MKEHEVVLSDEDWRFVERLVAEGRHGSVDEVMRDALRCLRDAEAASALARAVGAPAQGDYRGAVLPPGSERTG